MANLTEAQLEQIKFAEEDYPKAADELKKHEEYSSHLMNVLYNRMKEHKFDTVEECNYDGLIDFADKTRDTEGKMGNDLMYSYILGMEYAAASTIIDTSTAKYSLLRYVESEQKQGHNPTDTGMIWNIIKLDNSIRLTDRPALRGVYTENALFRDALLSEGIPEVKNILDDVLYHSQKYDVEGAEPFKGDFFLGSHMQLGNHNLLALDDMNIRGKQVLYAYEYCDNDLKTFSEKLRDRDEEMVAYVNRKSVEEGIKNNSIRVQRAMTGGASFMRKDSYSMEKHSHYMGEEKNLYIREDEYPEFQDDISKLDINMKNREIREHTSLSDGIKILEANGFETILNEPVEIMDASDTFIHNNTRCIVMHNKETGAIFYAKSAREDDICYSGAEITVATRDRGDYREFGHARYSRNENIYTHNITHNETNGMIAAYNKIVGQLQLEKDTTKLGYNHAFSSIPVPRLKNMDNIRCGAIWYEWKHPELKRYFSQNSRLSVTPYELNNIINCINIGKTIEKMPEDKRWIYQPFSDNRYSETMGHIYFSNNIFSNSLAMGICFRIEGTPQSEIDNYYDAALRYVDNPDYRDHEFNITELKANKGIFYGNSEIIDKYFDEFDIQPKSLSGAEFQYDNDSKEINITTNNSSIEAEAFKDFTRLETINIPDNITEIGEGAFKGCNNLCDVIYNDFNIIDYIDSESGSLTEPLSDIREEIAAQWAEAAGPKYYMDDCYEEDIEI